MEIETEDEFIIRYTIMENGHWRIAWMPKLYLKLSHVVTLPKGYIPGGGFGWGGKFHAIETVSGKRFDARNHDVRMIT